MRRRPNSFPALFQAGGKASQFAYGGMITATVGGNALAQIASGRRTISVSGYIQDHPHRFAVALELLLQNPKAREELRQLLDSYEETSL